MANPKGRLVGLIGDGATELIHVGEMALIGRLDVRAFVENAFNFPTATAICLLLPRPHGRTL